jgi:hypothetical protein
MRNRENYDMTDFEKSEQAVESQLKVDRFIQDHRLTIFEKLEENYCSVRSQSQAQLMFIAASLPLAAAIIHVGSTLDNFRRANEWVKESLPDSDPVSILSTLVLIYAVRKGWEEAAESEDDSKKMMWNEMAEWMQSLVGYA